MKTGLWPQTISKVEDDIALLCCEASSYVGGFIAAMFMVKDPSEDMLETPRVYWALPMFANGKFILQPHSKCPWCARYLPAVGAPSKRSSVN